jgi:alkylhydroperoxidase family enzyme
MVKPLSDEEMREDVLSLLSERFTKIPKAYRILARKPEVLFSFLEFRDEIMKKGSLDPKLKEMIAVKVSAANECNPCYTIHMKKLGDVCFEECDEKTKAALKFAEEAAKKRGKVGSNAFDNLSKYYSEDEILEITLVVSLYMFLNTFNSLYEFL